MTTGRGVRRTVAATVAALLCCGLLVSCGQERLREGAEVREGTADGRPADGSTDKTTDESEAEQPDLTTEGDGEPVLTSEEQMEGWYDAKADFRGHLASNSSRTDDVLAPMVVKVIIRKLGDTNEAQISVGAGAGSEVELQRTADAFATWRQEEYDDKGHMRVLGGAKMTVEKDW
ncbi:hypothetical protein [Streptomyces sp. NBC_00829]|uniref:hypothetical protein n=1 Tax=Streptomyces sp. NBC_00829 TaxID=2903679 RepID=UPI003865E016|nr:hypothetical protein OG293_35030 [Streptomyces sp. NBC_00829]